MNMFIESIKSKIDTFKSTAFLDAYRLFEYNAIKSK